MKRNASIFSISRESALAFLGSSAEGQAEGLFLVLCDRNISVEAKNALEKTAQSLGYGTNGVTYLYVCKGSEAIPFQGGSGIDALRNEPEVLSPNELFRAVEGIDPLSITLAGSKAMHAFFEAYRITQTSERSFRVFCREIRSLPDIDELMTTPEGKQIAWAALKTLPKL